MFILTLVMGKGTDGVVGAELSVRVVCTCVCLCVCTPTCTKTQRTTEASWGVSRRGNGCSVMASVGNVILPPRNELLLHLKTYNLYYEGQNLQLRHREVRCPSCRGK